MGWQRLKEMGRTSLPEEDEMKTVFFDLDGTILDVSNRYCRIYQDIMSKLGHSVIKNKKYWELKRGKTPIRDIVTLTAPIEMVKKYNAERLSVIESREYLVFDKIIPGSVEVLKSLSNLFHLILVTTRRNPENLKWELEQLGLNKFFKKVLVVYKDVPDRWRLKYDIIKKEGYFPGSVIVGDTETDILCGMELGIKTVAVLSGIRKKELLEKAQPDHIINNINELPELLSQQ